MKIIQKSKLPGGTDIQIEDWREDYRNIKTLEIVAYPKAKCVTEKDYFIDINKPFRLELTRFDNNEEVFDKFNSLENGRIELNDLREHFRRGVDDEIHLGLTSAEDEHISRLKNIVNDLQHGMFGEKTKLVVQDKDNVYGIYYLSELSKVPKVLLNRKAVKSDLMGDTYYVTIEKENTSEILCMGDSKEGIQKGQELLENENLDIESRIKLLKLMDNTARCVNDTDLFVEIWLSCGVPDEASEEDLREIAEDEEIYKDIESTFKDLMEQATLEGGLYEASEEEYEFAKKYAPYIGNSILKTREDCYTLDKNEESEDDEVGR